MDRQNALMSDEFKAARDVLLANRAAYDVVRQAMNDTRKTRCALPGYRFRFDDQAVRQAPD
jgi:hypothetical protein